MGDNNFQTPEKICDYMVSLLPTDRGITRVLEPTPGEGNLVQSLKKRKFEVVCPDSDFYCNILGWYNAIVMNPPFTPMKIGYDILYRCMEMTDVIIALMPWLALINSEQRTEDIFNFGLVSVTHLPRSVFKGSRVQTCVLKMIRGYNKITEFSALDAKFWWKKIKGKGK